MVVCGLRGRAGDSGGKCQWSQGRKGGEIVNMLFPVVCYRHWKWWPLLGVRRGSHSQASRFKIQDRGIMKSIYSSVSRGNVKLVIGLEC